MIMIFFYIPLSSSSSLVASFISSISIVLFSMHWFGGSGLWQSHIQTQQWKCFSSLIICSTHHFLRWLCAFSSAFITWWFKFVPAFHPFVASATTQGGAIMS
ncbi:hypothetical protein BJV77DRAFT_978496, partial [Russula vinacea]